MRVLITVEDELYGGAVVDFLASDGWAPGTMFKILHAVEPSYVGDRVTAVYGNDLQNEILKERTEYGQKLVAEIKDELQKKLGPDFPVETNVTIGRPHHVILHVAEDWKADMIAMGSHGRKGFSKFLLGSISLAVLSNANCSVIIVRLPGESKKEKESAKSEKGKAHRSHAKASAK